MSSDLLFQTIPVIVKAMQYNGLNKDDLQDFIGDLGILINRAEGGIITVCSVEGLFRDIHPFWWITICEDEMVTTWPPWIFNKFFKIV